MLNIKIHSFPAGAILPPHPHNHSQFCILLSGAMVQWTAELERSVSGTYYRCGNVWLVKGSSVHSAAVLQKSYLLTIALGNRSRHLKRKLGAAVLSILAISAARACDYGFEEFERDRATNLRLDVPDCFFEQLESAAAGGDTQAQLELGISYMEGYSKEPSDKILGPYWIKKAMEQGHPSANSILDSYMEEYSC